MLRVAERTFGKKAAPDVVLAWKDCSKGMREFPYHIGTVYSGPQQMGPANLLYLKPTGRKATMVCYPWDDLDGWRQVYPAEVFVKQMNATATAFFFAPFKLIGHNEPRIKEEVRLMAAAFFHFHSVATQSAFVALRDLGADAVGEEKREFGAQLSAFVKEDRQMAVNLFKAQQQDSRIGFEATNQYYYLPIDLMEKVVNCDHLMGELKK
jgi:hypothetical protein